MPKCASRTLLDGQVKYRNIHIKNREFNKWKTEISHLYLNQWHHFTVYNNTNPFQEWHDKVILAARQSHFGSDANTKVLCKCGCWVVLFCLGIAMCVVGRNNENKLREIHEALVQWKYFALATYFFIYFICASPQWALQQGGYNTNYVQIDHTHKAR